MRKAILELCGYISTLAKTQMQFSSAVAKDIALLDAKIQQLAIAQANFVELVEARRQAELDKKGKNV
jgi:hypothetical protein